MVYGSLRCVATNQINLAISGAASTVVNLENMDRVTCAKQLSLRP